MDLNHNAIYNHLVSLYGNESAKIYLPKIVRKIEEFRIKNEFGLKIDDVSEKDSILITYADQVVDNIHKPLRVLKNFIDNYLKGIINCIHILPFFPYSSDDGFSIVNYYQVKSEYGTWDEISDIGISFKMMFDVVINHVSSKSQWFKAFLEDDFPFSDYFISVEPTIDLTRVVRPRDLPLLTKFDTVTGEKYLWTTFSGDQIDLNFANPEVLLEILDILLFYVNQGADFIRLDAIAYAWKEVGTPCIHLPQTHRLVELFRLFLNKTAPHVNLITETNVNHIENISYFGNGINEAQLVYNFALPPLVLFGILTGNAHSLNKWASKLELPSRQTTFFNFLASHDGIGLNPARGILSEAEINYLVGHTENIGGFVSYKDNPDGSRSPYELNINYFDALSDHEFNLSDSDQINRFILAHAIMFSMIGIPGIYFHSLIGSIGWTEGVQLTDQKRAINRQRLSYPTLEEELSDPASRRHKIYNRLSELLSIRASSPAFHPFGFQSIINLDDRIYGCIRSDPDKKNVVLCLHNLSTDDIQINLKYIRKILGNSVNKSVNLITNHHILSGNVDALMLKAYQFYWFKINK